VITFFLLFTSIVSADNTVTCNDGEIIQKIPGVPSEALCADHEGVSKQEPIAIEERKIKETPKDFYGADRFHDPDYFKFAFWVEPIAFYNDYQNGGKDAPYISGGIGLYGQAFYFNLGYSYYYGLKYYETSDPIHGSSLAIGVAIPFAFRYGYSFQPFFGFKNHVSRILYNEEYLDYSVQAGFELGLKGSYEHFYVETGYVPGVQEIYRYRQAGESEPRDFHISATNGPFVKFGTVF